MLFISPVILLTPFDYIVFSVGFRTTPMDSTGVSHILEHTVLCGSQRYPVRDPFFKMLNRSLSTFMNAFTGASDVPVPCCLTFTYSTFSYKKMIVSPLFDFHLCFIAVFLQPVILPCILLQHKMPKTLKTCSLFIWMLHSSHNSENKILGE